MTLSIKIHGTELKIAYRYRKQGNNQTLMYVHGAGCSKDDIAAAYQRAELRDYPLLSFDFPGCGDSPPYPENLQLSIDDLADIVHAVAEMLQVPKVIIIGHSMGGAVALRYIDRHPQHVKAFIDVDSNLTAEEPAFSRTIVAQTVEQFESTGIRKLIDTFLAQTDRGGQMYAQALRRATPRVLHDYSASLIEHTTSGELLDIFLALSIPRMYLYGDAYRDKPVRYAEMFARHGITLTDIPGSAHWPMHDNPDAFYRTLGTFIRESGQRARLRPEPFRIPRAQGPQTPEAAYKRV